MCTQYERMVTIPSTMLSQENTFWFAFQIEFAYWLHFGLAEIGSKYEIIHLTK